MVEPGQRAKPNLETRDGRTYSADTVACFRFPQNGLGDRRKTTQNARRAAKKGHD
jgi:hypothetical protein